jgi:hypothetical protein
MIFLKKLKRGKELDVAGSAFVSLHEEQLKMAKCSNAHFVFIESM